MLGSVVGSQQSSVPTFILAIHAGSAGVVRDGKEGPPGTHRIL